MAIDKTLTDVYRRELDFDRYTVFEALPGHFDEKYPALVKFLQEYFKSYEEDGAPTEKVNDLLLSRDITAAKEELLSFISNELLLGKPYFESFNDKRTALQFSNLLYRSKGTEFSIKQFFRIFYGLDVDVRYGKDEIFYVGQPSEEVLEYEGKGIFGGSNFAYTFREGTILVEMTDANGVYQTLNQDTDFILDFSNLSIILQKVSQEDKQAERISDVVFEEFYEGGYVPVGSTLRITTSLDDLSAIGSEVSDKKLTNDKFVQLYALLISTPVGVSTWKEAYKTFVHPAGMYLAGQVSIVSVYEFPPIPSVPSSIQPPPPVVIVPEASIFRKAPLRSTLITDVSEIGPGPDGYMIRSRTNDMFRPNKIEGWHLQYENMTRADDINARTLDDTYGDLSTTINLIDEGFYHGYDYAFLSDSDDIANGIHDGTMLGLNRQPEDTPWNQS